jgi:hypothetical protein
MRRGVTIPKECCFSKLVGTARCAVRAAFSGAVVPPTVSQAGTSQRDVPTNVRLNQQVLVQSRSIFGEFFAKNGWRRGRALLASSATTFYEKN